MAQGQILGALHFHGSAAKAMQKNRIIFTAKRIFTLLNIYPVKFIQLNSDSSI